LKHLLFFRNFSILETGASILPFGCLHNAGRHGFVEGYGICFAFVQGCGVDNAWWLAGIFYRDLTSIQSVCQSFYLEKRF
jgi:hypothetical protein